MRFFATSKFRYECILEVLFGLLLFLASFFLNCFEFFLFLELSVWVLTLVTVTQDRALDSVRKTLAVVLQTSAFLAIAALAVHLH